MARTTGPILAAGAITLANQVILNKKPMDWRIPIATGLTAGVFVLLERGNESIAVPLAWLVLITTLFVRTNPGVRAPVETAELFWRASL